MPKYLLSLMIIILALGGALARASNEVTFEIRVEGNTLNVYRKIEKKGRADAFSNFFKTGEYVSRQIAEIIIFQLALEHSINDNFNYKLIFLPRKSYQYQTNIQALANGKILFDSDTRWRLDLEAYQDKVSMSEATIDSDEYVVGLYTSKGHIQHQLSSLKIVTNMDWTTDWLTLKKLNFPSIKNVKTWARMVKTVNKSNQHALIAPFSAHKNLLLKVGRNYLTPIHGIKILLPDSRHYAVSKKHPQGKLFFTLLNRGLTHLKQKGKLRDIYQQSGIFNKSVNLWPTMTSL